MKIKIFFALKPKIQYHLSQRGECVYGAQSWKDRRFLYESMSIPIEKRNSILKMVIKEAFLTKPKPQYHLSQPQECVYGA